MLLYLGTHIPSWLGRTSTPLFVSDRRLRKRKTYPRAVGRWALDSGGFTELSTYGEWRTGPREYVDRVRRYMSEIGGLDFAAIQDWMCEPWIVKGTGLTVREHQRRSVLSFVTLRDLAPEVPWLPVLQGWELDDYRRHVDDYAAAGVDLDAQARVGIGSVCRRQGMVEATQIVRWVARQGISTHLFGYKRRGLPQVSDVAVSSDSMAWSYAARREESALPGCTHRRCNNCIIYAEKWYTETVEISQPGPQLSLW